MTRLMLLLCLKGSSTQDRKYTPGRGRLSAARARTRRRSQSGQQGRQEGPRCRHQHCVPLVLAQHLCAAANASLVGISLLPQV